jgi:hypothetical protein
MTVAQINYLRALEDRRHNQAQEEIAREQQDVQRYVADTQAASSRYVADTQATSSRYATDKQFTANTYATDTNAATQRYVSDQNASVNRFATQTQADTSRYATDRQFDTQSARLQFDRDTQSFKNALAFKQYQLDEMVTRADTALKRAQVKRIANDIEVATKNLQLQAERLGMDKEAQEYQNLYTQVKTWESAATTAEKSAKVIESFSRLLKGLHDWVHDDDKEDK